MDRASHPERRGDWGNDLDEEFVNWQKDTRSRPYNEGRSSLRSSYKSSPTLSTSVRTSETPPGLPSTNGNGLPTMNDYGQRPRTAQRSASNDSYRTGPGPATHVQKLRHRPSENTRLHVSSKSSIPSPTEWRNLPQSPSREEYSKPISPILKDNQGPTRPVLSQSSTFPLQARDEDFARQGFPLACRDRGRSTSSSRSNSTYTSIPLRPSTSIPDYSIAESTYSRQRNLSSYSNYRPARGSSDTNFTNHRREPPIRPNGFESQEVRESFRSALTNASSYLTSGTERSSVLTKSSSATSINGHEEGMSVDEAIEMYETGFVDSDREDDCSSRPGTSPFDQNSKLKPPDSSTDSLGLPAPPDFIIRNSKSMFEEPEGGFVSLESHNSYKQSGPPRALVQPSEDIIQNGNTHNLSRSTTLSSPRSFDETRDRYGFYKKSQHVSVAQYESWNGPYSDYLRRRRKKWVALLKESNLPSERPSRFPPKSTKVKRFIRKGIPPDWRGAAWFYYAGGPAMIGMHHGLYDELVQRSANGEVSPTDEDDLERDLNRTFPDNIRFKPDPRKDQGLENGNRNSTQTITEPETPILQSLRRVLRAFAIHNPRVGYCQSLNFLAGLLLLFMDEEKSFWLLNIIACEYLPGTHARTLEGANVDLGVLMMSVKETMPSIWSKIGGELDGSAGSSSSSSQVVPLRLPPVTLCCSAWFMSCFIGTFPIETTLRVWDSFFYEGSKTFFRIALAIFKIGEAEIKAVSDPMEIFQVVQTIPRRLLDANVLMESCFKRRNGFGHLSQETIETRRADRRRGYAEERARVAGGASSGEVVVAPERKATIFSRRRGKRAATGVDLG